MSWRYYRCLNCKSTLKTTVDNPDGNIKCVICGDSKFVEITEKELETMEEMKAENGS